MKDASIRFFTSLQATAEHVFKLINILWMPNSLVPQSYFKYYLFTAPEVMTTYIPVYQANMRLLQNNLELESLVSRERGRHDEIKSIKNRIDVEERREKEALRHKEQLYEQIAALKIELANEQAKTDAMLGNRIQQTHQTIHDVEIQPPRALSPPRKSPNKLTVRLQRSSWR
jgi:hypothetical protein